MAMTERGGASGAERTKAVELSPDSALSMR